MAQLKCNDLSGGYENREVFKNVSFEVNAGEYLCIVGENGAGKTTLMRTILGLQPPLGGSVETGDGVGRTDIGYLPQQTAVQKDFPASVFEIVLSGRQGKRGIRPFYSAEDKRIARQAIERMGISALAGRCYRELSGGQQQRVLLARALTAADKMLLLDEPVTGLDPKATEEMYALISLLNASGITIMMITHDTASAAKYATHLLRVADGTAVKEANLHA